MSRATLMPALLLAGVSLFSGDERSAPSRSRPESARRAEVSLLPAARAEEPRPITVSFVGDILLAEGVGRVAAARGAEYLFAEVKPLLASDDLTIGNLECAVASCGSSEKKKYAFRADPAVLRGVRESGVDAVSVANNHTLDYGQEALLETLRHVRHAELAAAGGGRDIVSANRPVLLPVGTQRVALVAASRVLPSAEWKASAHRAGLASAYEPSRLLAEIRGIRAQADVVAVYFHWGKERAISPEAQQRTLARRCIDAGADLVIGSHPHVLQGFEYYRGKLIAYSLGNFVFTDHGKTTAILQTTFDEGILTAARVIPCRILNYRPHIISEPAARRDVLRGLEGRSFGVRIGDDGAISAPWADGAPEPRDELGPRMNSGQAVRPYIRPRLTPP